MICSECNKRIPDKKAKLHHNVELCDDCYIDKVMPKMIKAHYDNDAEFMNRLKDSYSVHKQRYH